MTTTVNQSPGMDTIPYRDHSRPDHHPDVTIPPTVTIPTTRPFPTAASDRHNPSTTHPCTPPGRFYRDPPGGDSAW
jgi:hypothetical protein